MARIERHPRLPHDPGDQAEQGAGVHPHSSELEQVDAIGSELDHGGGLPIRLPIRLGTNGALISAGPSSCIGCEAKGRIVGASDSAFPR